MLDQPKDQPGDQVEAADPQIDQHQPSLDASVCLGLLLAFGIERRSIGLSHPVIHWTWD